MKKLLLASSNKNKIAEINALLEGQGWQILSLDDFPAFEMPPEDGDTFVKNAMIKALAAAEYSGILTIADDSGLAVEYLDGAPGIYSARFAGLEKDSEANNRKLLKLLEGVPKEKRQAAFHAAIALATPLGDAVYIEQTCEGEITLCECGKNGFGYDPLFFIPEKGCTMAELTSEEKNVISHRGKALRKILPLLKDMGECYKAEE